MLSTDTLKDEDKKVLKIRMEAECNVDVNLDTICTFHKCQFIDKYSRCDKSGCDVLGTHIKAIPHPILCVITLGTIKPEIFNNL